MAISAVVFHANEAAPEASEVRDMFRYHGIWAPGVRLFRRLQFRSKALIISAVFLLPILLLAAGFWSSMQQTVDFAVKERAGVAAMRSLVPVLEGVLKVRFATRSISGGFDANAERRQMWNDTDKAIAAFEQGLKNDGDPLGMLGAVSQLATDWRATAESLDARDGKGLSVFAPVSKTLVSLLDRVGDDSNLVLDPDVDSFYLVTGLVLTLPAAAEDLARVWGWSTYAAAKGGMEFKDSERFQVGVANAISRLNDSRKYVGRSLSASPELAVKFDLTPIDAALAFVNEASVAVDAGGGDAATLYRHGLAATSALFHVYAGGLPALDGLLVARIEAAQHSRQIRIGLVVLCLALVGYLFHTFYLVTHGGLTEVKRHLTAMARGDLTTSPSPWGRDEAAELMISLQHMQASLRNIVERVRGSSESIVEASTEIASASMDLSVRTEQTAANLQQSASSMEQISSTVQHTAGNVREAAQVASCNSQAAARGGSVIAEVVSTMQDINTSSKKIGDIIGTIDGIAFQTNILALNAAVEAARAGEQGRGFAVVAAEVRSLAQRSAQAAKEIKLLIETSVEKVDSGTRVVKGAGDTMRELVVNAGRMNDLLRAISTAATEQSSGVSQVGTAVTDLDRMTQQNAALVEQTAASASALRDQAIGLAREVSRFRLPAGVAA